MTEGKDFSAGLRTVKHQRFRSEGKRYVMQGADGIKIGTKAVWRRLPSLLYREFPNPLRAREFRDVRKFQCPADLEIGDTAGLETRATPRARWTKTKQPPRGFARRLLVRTVFRRRIDTLQYARNLARQRANLLADFDQAAVISASDLLRRGRRTWGSSLRRRRCRQRRWRRSRRRRRCCQRRWRRSRRRRRCCPGRQPESS